ncbi:Acg family FMN-binding oxidoreductase [Subtercola sp. RTI3]|uniref:Acg family FMN-binding oxidoreductase n=1 Tax=Subtercola sp. RTI3 TaxID=3048639 RepID=UPI002B227246|nr:hypothetical protein [Subtercola sp. RTI3]MEA9984870.1 hypothetical protein [Subtercola sp. RTI3]
MGIRRQRGKKIVLINVASVIGGLGVVLLVVLTVGGLFVPANYLQPWSREYAGQFADPRMQVAAQALLAPSSHNMQPWTIRLDPSDPDVLYLYADPSRLTPAVDPEDRQTMLSQGTFLSYLRVSALHLGYSSTFDLFPQGAYDETDLASSMRAVPVAKITLTKSLSTESTDYGSLFLSDTNRSPYTPAPVTANQSAELSRLAASSGAALTIYDKPKDLAAFAAFGTEGTLIETQYDAATKEFDRLFYATESAKNEERSGFAVEGQGTSGFMKYLIQGMITIDPALNDDATGAKRSIDSTAAAVAHTPNYALISTAGNTRTEQVSAGILYGNFSLRARSLGLVMQPLSQVLQEYPSMAAPYDAIRAEYAPDGQTIQMMVRLGTSTTDYPQTMRRDVNSLLG